MLAAVAVISSRPRRTAATVHDWERFRHATWMELFFDLVFVVAVSRLGQLLLDDSSPAGTAVFGGLFVSVWWLWISFSYFADLFDTDHALHRLAQLAAMLGAVVLAVTLDGGVGEDNRRYAAVYAALLVLLAMMYAAVAARDRTARPLALWFVTGSSAGAVLWTASLVVPAPLRYVVWGLALVVNATISGPVAYARVREVPRQRSHMPERFGLFTIVVLGEAILAGSNAIAATAWNRSAVLVAVVGFVLGAAVWWLYFAGFDEDAIDRAIQGGTRAQVRSFLYGYGHLLIYASIVATAIAVEHAADEAAHHGTAHRHVLLGTSQLVLVAGFVIVSEGIGARLRPANLLTKAIIVAVAAVVSVLALAPFTAVALSTAAWVTAVISYLYQSRRLSP